MKTASDQPSQCKEIRRHLGAYLDEEITDTSLLHSVQIHLDGCSGCQLEIDALKALDLRLQSLPVMAVPERLREGVEALARESIETRNEGSTARLSRLPMWTMGAVAASLLIFSVLGIWMWSAQDEKGESHSAERRDLIAFVDDYVAYVQSDSTPVVETPDPHKMEGWLAARLDFAPKLPRWSWAELISGRLCFIHNHRVARVQYNVGENVLTLFIQPLSENVIGGDEETPKMGSLKMQSLRGFKVACWRSSELDYVLVGPSSSADLFTNLETELQNL